MFIEFQVGNFRSFRDIQKFTMQAAPKRTNDGGLEEGNVFETDGFRLLKSKAVYGSNASGKSNLGKAISAFSLMIVNSVSREDISQMIWNDRFQLISEWEEQPVFFQYSFIVHSIIYRYGFQILSNNVVYEWLFGKGEGEGEVLYFMRNPEGLKIEEKYFSGSSIYMDLALNGDNELFRPDSLFLTGAALNGNKFAASLRNAITSAMIVDGTDDRMGIQSAMRDLDKGTEEEKLALIQLMKAADTGVEDLRIFRMSDNILEKHFTKDTRKKIMENEKENIQTLFSFHSKYDDEGKIVEQIHVPFGKWESEGTAKLLGIGALILKSLRMGRTMIIDEFDARIHPNLTLKFLQLYNSKDTNPLNAQLIFITHDSGLLRRAELRRDQICFVNKDKYGISTLKTLIEYKGVRKDASYEKEYLNGSYDAVPYLKEMDWVVTNKTVENGL